MDKKNGVAKGMKIEKKTSYICFRVSPREKAEYKELAATQGFSLGRLIRTAIERFVNELSVGSSNGGNDNEKGYI